MGIYFTCMLQREIYCMRWYNLEAWLSLLLQHFSVSSFGLWCIWQDYDLIFLPGSMLELNSPRDSRNLHLCLMVSLKQQGICVVLTPDQQDEAESSAANDFPALRCTFLHFHFVSMSFPICSLHLNSLAFNSFTTVSYYHII